MSGRYCSLCGEMDYSDAGDRPCACALMAEHVNAGPTVEEECAGRGHQFYGDEADCEDGRLHAAGEPCLCGRCYCGGRRYHRGGTAPAEATR